MHEFPFSIFGSRVRAGIFQGDVLAGLPYPAQLMNQVHGTRIARVSSYGEAPEADALVSRTPGIRLMVKTADCIPLVLADEEAGVIAAVHAGWRGLTADILPLTIARLLEMGAQAKRLKVAIGPSLGTECAVFSNPFVEIPEKYHWAIQEGGHVDLNGIAARQLQGAGIMQENLEWLKICTACNDEWFSWRRNKDARRFGTWIELLH